MKENNMRTQIVVAAYLLAIVLANLSVAAFGPPVIIFNAFVLIGLDLTARDVLHEHWHHSRLRSKMALLIAAGGALSWILNADAGRIALASTVAFALAALIDTVIYQRLLSRPFLQRVNVSNVGGAAVDSIAFPTLAFGVFLPWIILGQFAAKVAGGFIWSLILRRWREPKLLVTS